MNNLTLKKLSLKDLPSVISVLKDSEVSSKLDYKVPGSILKGLAEVCRRKNTYKFSILLEKKFVGLVVLEKPSIDKKTYEIGYFISRPYWGKGIATGAVKRICQFGFETLGLKKIIAVTTFENPGSGKVLEKEGFKKIKINKKNKEVLWEKKK